MEFKGKVSFREIDRKAVQFTGTQADAWVQSLLEDSAPQVIVALGLSSKDWAQKAELNVTVAVEKMGQDYVLRGSFSGFVVSPCSRCGDPFKAKRNTPQEFNVIIQRVARGQASEGENLDSGDPDFIITEADELDINGLLREQLIILEPLAECPAFDSTGKCSLCGIVPKTQATTSQHAFSEALGGVFQKIPKN